MRNYKLTKEEYKSLLTGALENWDWDYPDEGSPTGEQLKQVLLDELAAVDGLSEAALEDKSWFFGGPGDFNGLSRFLEVLYNAEYA